MCLNYIEIIKTYKWFDIFYFLNKNYSFDYFYMRDTVYFKYFILYIRVVKRIYFNLKGLKIFLMKIYICIYFMLYFKNKEVKYKKI